MRQSAQTGKKVVDIVTCFAAGKAPNASRLLVVPSGLRELFHIGQKFVVEVDVSKSRITYTALA